ncbi:MAG: efflux RND transporter periplasmic adaptor subunit [Planctomycetota bacterium]
MHKENGTMGFRYPIAWLQIPMVLALSGCGQNEFQPPPPPAVAVSLPAQRDVVAYSEFTGTTSVATSVDVRARVSGILQEVRYEAGSLVEAGDPLFEIDPEPFVATRDALQAQVESAKAELRLAETKADRIERSARDGALSEIQALEARAAAEAAAALVKVKEKELAIRQLDVDYTDIRAPISGRVERSPYEQGDLVGTMPNDSLLTTVYDDSEINVYFSVPDRVYLRVIRSGRSGGRSPVVEIATEIDEGYPFAGEIDYTDPVVDERSGTVQIRAIVDNSDGRLLGGLFARLRIPGETIVDALLVPEAAISTDQIGPYLLVVNGSGVVERRDVSLGPVDGADRVITSGLNPEDSVVVRGLLRARPGATVDPQPLRP